MNERIQELSDIAYKNHLKNNPESSFGRRADYDKEFAELIVRECAGIANKQFSAASGLDDRDSWTAAEMKKHFGVEE